ncbi:hypothetical protein C1O63_0194 [Dehalococcoides mccartyi]|nr:hypothetical protein C1O63_0194 [Dehalococcoides mccartyi]
MARPVSGKAPKFKVRVCCRFDIRQSNPYLENLKKLMTI